MTHILLLVLGFKKEKGKKAHCWTLVAPFVSHKGLRLLRAHTGSDVGPDRHFQQSFSSLVCTLQALRSSYNSPVFHYLSQRLHGGDPQATLTGN